MIQGEQLMVGRRFMDQLRAPAKRASGSRGLSVMAGPRGSDEEEEAMCYRCLQTDALPCPHESKALQAGHPVDEGSLTIYADEDEELDLEEEFEDFEDDDEASCEQLCRLCPVELTQYTLYPWMGSCAHNSCRSLRKMRRMRRRRTMRKKVSSRTTRMKETWLTVSGPVVVHSLVLAVAQQGDPLILDEDDAASRLPWKKANITYHRAVALRTTAAVFSQMAGEKRDADGGELSARDGQEIPSSHPCGQGQDFQEGARNVA